MDTNTLYELIGYLASALIVVSLLMSSLLRLRVIGLAGAVTFTVYGVLIRAWPIVVANGVIVFIHLYHLGRMLRAKAHHAYFEVMEVPSSSPVLQRFLDFYDEDLRRFQPDFRGFAPDDARLSLLILRDAVPVGAVLADVDGEVARIHLDYVSPQHRDLRAGAFLWGESEAFRRRGVHRIETTAPTREHAHYLAAVGFEPEGDRWTRDA